MRATLWDGVKQIHGELEFETDKLVFELEDFKQSSLSLEIHYTAIIDLSFKKIYNIEGAGLQITSSEGKQDLFVVENIGDVMLRLKEIIS
jgi:hypothetical protein